MSGVSSVPTEVHATALPLASPWSLPCSLKLAAPNAAAAQVHLLEGKAGRVLAPAL